MTSINKQILGGLGLRLAKYHSFVTGKSELLHLRAWSADNEWPNVILVGIRDGKLIVQGCRQGCPARGGFPSGQLTMDSLHNWDEIATFDLARPDSIEACIVAVENYFDGHSGSARAEASSVDASDRPV